MKFGRDEGGWALIALVVALAIVAFLAREALSAYLGGATRALATAPQAARVAPDPRDAAGAAGPSMQRHGERARGVEAAVVREFDARAKSLEALDH